MDKNRARITIKLGQASDTAKMDDTEKESSVPRLSAASERLDSDSADSVEESHVELDKKEEDDVVISKSEIAVGKDNLEDVEESFYGPKYVPSNRRKYKSRLKHNRDMNSKGVLGIVASVTGAVAVGLMFGYIVLSFFESGFIGQPSESKSVTSPSTLEGKSIQVGEAQKNEGQQAQSGPTITIPEETDTISIQFPETKHYVVQGGVFKDQGSASPIVESIKSKGWPSSFLGENPAHLILGLAGHRDHVLPLASQYKDLEVYVKELTEEPKKASITIKQGVTMTQEEWDQWFKVEQTFIGTLAGAISSGLSTGKLEDTRMKEITEAHRQLLQNGRGIVGKLPESQQSLGNRMLNDFTKSVTALEQYAKQPTVGYLWQAEQALLDAYLSKQKLFSSFK